MSVAGPGSSEDPRCRADGDAGRVGFRDDSGARQPHRGSRFPGVTRPQLVLGRRWEGGRADWFLEADPVPRVGGTRERSRAPPACGGRKRGERLPGAGSPPAFVNLQEPCRPVGGRGGLSRLWRLSGRGCTLTPPPPPQGRAHRRAAGRAGGRQPGHEADHHRDAGAGPGPGESRLRAHLQGYRGS